MRRLGSSPRETFCFLLLHGSSASVFLTHGAGETVAITQDFRVQGPFTLRAVCLCVPYRVQWHVYVFLCVLWFGASFPHAQTVGVVFPCCEPCSLITFWDYCLPCVLLAVVLKFVLGHCGFPIRGLSFPLSMLGVGFSFVWDCVSCPAVTLRNCVCCGLLISTTVG